MIETTAEKNNRFTRATSNDAELKRALERLVNENSRLKKLVVQLSETVLRNVTEKQ